MERRPPPHLDVVAIKKGAFGSPSTKVTYFVSFMYYRVQQKNFPRFKLLLVWYKWI